MFTPTMFPRGRITITITITIAIAITIITATITITIIFEIPDSRPAPRSPRWRSTARPEAAPCLT